MPPAPRKSPWSESFEEKVIATLEVQDRLLERLEEKLERPVLNGGFDRLVEKVDTIERVTSELSVGQDKLRSNQDSTGKKVDDIHTIVLDPNTGLYHRVKANSLWIDTTSKVLKWLGGLLVVGVLTGIGKLLYDFFSGHIHFTP